jgi:hypothetical protein
MSDCSRVLVFVLRCDFVPFQLAWTSRAQWPGRQVDEEVPKRPIVSP